MTTKTKPKIAPEEMERRREGINQAVANNRIEGIVRDSRADSIVEAYVNGDFDTTEAIKELDKIYKK